MVGSSHSKCTWWWCAALMDPPNSLVNVSLELKVRARRMNFCTHQVESCVKIGDDPSLEHESLDSKVQ